MDELTLTWHIVLRLQGHVTDSDMLFQTDAAAAGKARSPCFV